MNPSSRVDEWDGRQLFFEGWVVGGRIDVPKFTVERPVRFTVERPVRAIWVEQDGGVPYGLPCLLWHHQKTVSRGNKEVTVAFSSVTVFVGVGH
jgi:hypothetical protein